MNTANTPALIVNDGTLGGLCASWAAGIVRGRESNAQPSTLWFPADDRPAVARRKSAVQRQVELCGLTSCSDRQLVKFEPGVHGLDKLGDRAAAGTRTHVLLLNACLEAADRGLNAVLWPIHLGGPGNHSKVEIEPITAAFDRARLASQAALIDFGRTIRIQTPYLDLTDAQMMELALDMDAPLGACWWCLNEQADPCGQCAQCLRWREALIAVDPTRALKLEVLQQNTAAMATSAGE